MIIDETEELMLSPRRLTSLERGRAAVKFVRMNEQPQDYILDNRYLERGKFGSSVRRVDHLDSHS